MYFNLGIVGRPLSHTLSPSIHGEFLKSERLNGGYVCFEAESASCLEDLSGFWKRYGFSGINVTVPYKIDVMRLCCGLSREASEVGAVNTLVFDGGSVAGHNTDLAGFSKMLEDADVRTEGKRVLVLGAGGAAAAVLAYLKRNEPSLLTLANRTREKAESAVFAKSLKAEICDFTGAAAREYDVVINCSSLGLKGGSFPQICSGVTEAAVDLQYGTSVTPFLSLFKDRGVKTVDGFPMLVWQAAESFYLWTGRRVVPDVSEFRKLVNCGG